MLAAAVVAAGVRAGVETEAAVVDRENFVSCAKIKQSLIK